MSLGLSIGQTNLVAVPAGRPPLSRRAILALYPDRPAEVGIPTQPGGLVLTGFVERVGDRRCHAGRQEAVGHGVAREDVGERWRQHHAEAVVVQRPDGVLA